MLHCIVSINIQKLILVFSQGSVAAYFRCGGVSNAYSCQMVTDTWFFNVWFNCLEYITWL